MKIFKVAVSVFIISFLTLFATIQGENNSEMTLTFSKKLASFNDTSKSMTVAPNGAIYVADQTEHLLLKFNRKGELVRKFGKKGHEDGGLFYPGFISVLDNHWLVINNFPKKQKLSIFNLNGDFAKSISLNHPAYKSVALKDNKVAYVRWRRDFPSEEKREITVYIKDIETGEEKEVLTHYVRDPNLIYLKDNSRLLLESYGTGDLMIEKTGDGNLLVAITTDPQINIYTPEGFKTNSFLLSLDPIEINEKMEKDFQKALLYKQMKKDYWKTFGKTIEKEILARKFFNSNLPLFRKILVDEQGKIWVLKEDPSFNKNNVFNFQIYSKSGNLLQNVALNSENYEFNIDQLRWFSQIHIDEGNILALVEPKDKNADPLALVQFKANLKNVH